MKKIYLSVVTILIMISLLLPIQSLAATSAVIKVGKENMTVGETVEVKITTSSQSESIQFDLDFDATKFEYVNGSASTNKKLEMTSSSLIDSDTVRLSAVSTSGKTTDTVVLTFRAIATGSSVPFKVAGGQIETATIAGGIVMDTVANPVANVAKIGPAPVKDNGTTGGGPVYVGSNGQVITELPKTGLAVAVSNLKSVGGIYETIIPGKKTVLYALSDSDVALTVGDVKAEFEDTTNNKTINTTSLNTDVGTGNTFNYTGDLEIYTIVVYGDINGDGKVTSYDVLLVAKGGLTGVQAIAAEVDAKDPANAIQQFILKRRLQTSGTGTILDKIPVEFYGMTVTTKTDDFYRYENNTVATVTADAQSIALNDNMLTNNTSAYLTYNIDAKPAGDTGSTVVFEKVTDGKYNVVLKNATVAGTYKITPVVKGTKADNGEVNGTQITIEVKEDTTVNDIDLVVNGANVGKSVTIAMNTKLEAKVLYYHKYSNNERALINTSDVTKDITIVENVIDGNVSGVQPLAEDKRPKATNDVLNYVQLSTVKIGTGSANVGKENLKFVIKNDPSNPANDVVVNVEITIEGDAESIYLNNTRIENMTNINLYSDPDDAVNGDIVREINGNVYTIFSIDVAYKDGTKGYVYASQIVYSTEEDNESVAGKGFVEFSDTTGDDLIEVIPLYKSGDDYIKETTTTAPIEYVGITFVEDDITELTSITIWNDVKNADGTVVRSAGKAIPVSFITPSVGPMSLKAAPMKAVEEKTTETAVEKTTTETTVSKPVDNTVANTVGNTVANEVGNTASNTVGNTVANGVANKVANTVANEVGNTVSNTVGNTVANEATNTVANTVGNTVANEVANTVANTVGNTTTDM